MLESTKTGSLRVEYLIMAHKLPQQLRRLIQRLTGPEAHFTVSVDARSDLVAFEQALQGLPVAFVDRRFATRWGHYNFTRAILAGMQQIVDKQIAFDYLVILSGQDYPLVSRSALLAHFMKHRGHSLVHHVPVAPTDTHLRERLEKYHIFLPFNRVIIYPYDSKRGLKAILNRGLHWSGKFPLPRRLPLHYEAYFGANWMQLSDLASRYLVNQMQRQPALETYFRYTLLSEEHLFQTLLVNASEAQRGPLVNVNYTFSHWHRPPELYTQPLGMTDLEAMRESGCLMARKFDITYDESVLNWLDVHAS